MVENPFKNPLVITILTVWEIKTEKLFTYVCNMHAYDMHIHVLGVHISAGVCVCVCICGYLGLMMIVFLDFSTPYMLK